MTDVWWHAWHQGAGVRDVSTWSWGGYSVSRLLHPRVPEAAAQGQGWPGAFTWGSLLAPHYWWHPHRGAGNGLNTLSTCVYIFAFLNLQCNSMNYKYKLKKFIADNNLLYHDGFSPCVVRITILCHKRYFLRDTQDIWHLKKFYKNYVKFQKHRWKFLIRKESLYEFDYANLYQWAMLEL